MLSVACSGELSPGATVAQAATETRDAGSARVAYIAQFDAVSAQGPIPLTGEGVFDYANGRGRMTFGMSALLEGVGRRAGGFG